METWISEAISKWNLSKIKLNSGASIADIEKAETILSFNFPDDFKSLYQIVNGFRDLDWQENMFTFWPLEMIIDEYDEADKGFIGFSDYSLKVNAIGFKRGEEGIFKIYPSLITESSEYIAPSFKEVVRMINSDTGSIY